MNIDHSPEHQEVPPDQPVQDTAGLDRYILRGRRQIIQILQEMIDDRCLMSAHIRGGLSYVSTVLAVEPEQNAILLDASPNPSTHARALEATQLLCTSQLNRIRVQFSVEGIRQASIDGRPALRASIPTEILRLQRREFFRLQVPIAHGIAITLPPAAGSEGPACEARVIDLSCNGAAVLVPPGVRTLTIGEVVPGCTLRLIDQEPLSLALEVRNINRQTKPNGTEQLRIGLRFESMPRSAETRIQRYIFNTEREINARTLGGL